MSFFEQRNVNSAVTPVLTMILGLILIMNPAGVGKGVAVIVGIVLLLSGAMDLGRYFLAREAYFNRNSDIIAGVIKCLVGLAAVARPGRLLSLIVNVAGVFVALNGVKAISNSLGMRSVGMPGWTVSMVFSVLFLLAGISMLFNPFGTVSTVFTILGVLVLLSGIFSLLQWYGMRRMRF